MTVSRTAGRAGEGAPPANIRENIGGGGSRSRTRFPRGGMLGAGIPVGAARFGETSAT